jgi:hypothetical protein
MVVDAPSSVGREDLPGGGMVVLRWRSEPNMVHLRCFAKGVDVAAYKGFEEVAPDADLDVSILIEDAGSAVEKLNAQLGDGATRCRLLQLSDGGVVVCYETSKRGADFERALTLLVPWHAVITVEVTAAD